MTTAERAVGFGRQVLERAAIKDAAPAPSRMATRWAVDRQRQEDGQETVYLRLVSVPMPETRPSAFELQAAVKDTPESRELQRAIDSDAGLAPILGKWLLAAGTGVTVQAETLVEMFIGRLLETEPRPVRDEEIEACWHALIDNLDSLTYDVRTVAPLIGFRGPTGAIDLGDGVEIAPMTDEELLKGMFVGALQTPFPSMVPLWVTSTWCLRRARRETGVFVDKDDTVAFAEFSSRVNEDEVRFERVIDALRVFGDTGSVTASAVYNFPTTLPIKHPYYGEGVQTGRMRGSREPAASYELDQSRVDEFKQFFFDANQCRTSSPALDAAFRRFGYAMERRRADDRITDLIIVCESLLLDDSERGEKRFQVSLGVAKTLEPKGKAGEAIFEFVKRAYDVRSAIVHGGTPKPKLLRGLTGETLEINAFAGQLEQLIRRMLRAWVDEMKNGKGSGSEWRAQLFE